MRYARALTLFLLTALLAAAPAAHARTPRPYVKSVTPLNVSVGEQMTVEGFYFRKGYAENTVVFVAPDGRVAYVKSEHSTRTKLTVIVPAKVGRLLNLTNGSPVATKFKIKVIARRVSRLARRPLAQPTVGPDVGGDCDHDGTPNPTDSDDDGDVLPDSIELKIRTNPCAFDSDGDKLLDGWEYLSSLDLNNNALPYPASRPYPNALFADHDVDHDGDGLPAWAEHVLWWRGGHKYPLDYSDGDQKTAPTPTGTLIWNDWDYDGVLSDDERDFDGDGLANMYEFGSPDWAPWEPAFPGSVRPDWLDPDTDGDGVLDGWDDQDHDDYSNIAELQNGTWVMNPCDPVVSRVCPRWLDDGSRPARPKNQCVTRSVLDYAGLPDPNDEYPDFPYIPKWSKPGDYTVSPDGPGYCATYPYKLLPSELAELGG